MEQTIGKRIAAARKQAGLTQDKLAEQLGVTAQAVSKWENDQSCPDVTMLPRLAEIFGTTTDALLGVEAAHQAETAQKPESGEVPFPNDRADIQLVSRRGSIGFALWVLLTGALLLANIILPQLNHDNFVLWPTSLPVWDIVWPAGLLAFGLVGLYPRFSLFRLGCALFGGYTLVGYFMGRFFNQGVLLPILMIVLGMGLLADALRKPERSVFSIHGGRLNRSGYSVDGDRFTCSTSFGGDNRRVDLPRLSGGEASVSFGELSLDLTGCGEIIPNAAVTLDCSFGHLEIRIPRACRAECSTNTAFASVHIKGRPADDAAVLYLDCNASFGEIEIVYI